MSNSPLTHEWWEEKHTQKHQWKFRALKLKNGILDDMKCVKETDGLLVEYIMFENVWDVYETVRLTVADKKILLKLKRVAGFYMKHIERKHLHTGPKTRNLIRWTVDKTFTITKDK